MAVSTDLKKIINNALVKEVMTKEVFSLQKTETVYKAMQAMSKHYYSAIIVTENKKPVGIVSERDLLNRVFLKEKDPRKTKLADIMTKSVSSISPDDSILKAGNIMNNKKIKRLVVLKDEEIAGLITQTDIISGHNNIYVNYKTLLWNPWVSVILFALITIMFLINLYFFRR